MGLFDRFKKKQEPKQQTTQMPQSILLDYGENGTADLKFMGLIDIDGKILSNVVVTYIDEKKEFKQGSFLLEPNMVQDQKGNLIDGTEKYYRTLSSQYQDAMKKFFDKEAVMDDAQGSNYIGGLQIQEDGSWSRNYDVNFRDKYRQQAMLKRQQTIQHNQSVHEQNEAAIKAASDKILAQGKHNEQLYNKMQQDIATNEEINEYYSNVHYKYEKDRIYQKPEI